MGTYSYLVSWTELKRLPLAYSIIWTTKRRSLALLWSHWSLYKSLIQLVSSSTAINSPLAIPLGFTDNPAFIGFYPYVFTTLLMSIGFVIQFIGLLSSAFTIADPSYSVHYILAWVGGMYCFTKCTYTLTPLHS